MSTRNDKSRTLNNMWPELCGVLYDSHEEMYYVKFYNIVHSFYEVMMYTEGFRDGSEKYEDLTKVQEYLVDIINEEMPYTDQFDSRADKIARIYWMSLDDFSPENFIKKIVNVALDRNENTEIKISEKIKSKLEL